MADIIQDVGVKGIMEARWLLGGLRRLDKATSSVVVFFDRKLALGSHLKLRGCWLPIETCHFDSGRGRVECSDRRSLVLAFISCLYYPDRLLSFLLQYVFSGGSTAPNEGSVKGSRPDHRLRRTALLLG